MYWNTVQSHNQKALLLASLFEAKDVRKRILEFSLSLAFEEVNGCVLPSLFIQALYNHQEYLGDGSFLGHMCHFSLNYNIVWPHFDYEYTLLNELDTRLLKPSEDAHWMILNMLVWLHNERNEAKQPLINKLIVMTMRLGYGDLFWLYCYHFLNPTHSPIVLHTHHKVTNLLIDFLFSLKSGEISIRAIGERFESRTVNLFRTIISMLLREERYEKALSCYHFMAKILEKSDQSLHYIKETQKEAPEQYAHFLTLITVS